jgi:HD superfamily phosphohydrolase
MSELFIDSPNDNEQPINGITLQQASRAPLEQQQHRVVYLQCPIYQQIQLADYQVQILKSPHFQRLARVKQLGLSHLVYPGATHTRLSHSLGVAHLARTLIEHLRRAQPDLEIDERDERLIVIAAQLHDLAHGPYSHAFESWLHEAHPEMGWQHEKAALQLLVQMIQDGFVPTLQSDHLGVQRIGVFIRGLYKDEDIPDDVLPKSKRWMVDIVANGRSSVDVDKMDYIVRDEHFALGSKSSTINIDRILRNARVLGDRQRISFHEKTSFALVEMFHQRWCLFKEIYSHDKTVAAEVMLKDVFSALDSQLHITENVRVRGLFHLLDDSILQVARWRYSTLLESAHGLIDRIEQRDLYPMLAKRVVDDLVWQKAKKEDAIGALIKIDPWLNQHKNKLVLHVMRFHYGSGSDDPLKHIYFYKWESEQQPHLIASDDLTRMLPRNFSEYCLRLFFRDTKEKVVLQREELKQRATAAFARWIDDLTSFKTNHSPSKENSPSASALIPVAEYL